MARMTADDMIRIIRKTIGSPDENEFTDADALRCLNMAQERVAVSVRPSELITETSLTTTASTQDYEVSFSDELIILGIEDTTNDSRLLHIDDLYYRMISQGATESGNPEFWYEIGTGSNGRTQVRLYPVPDGTYTLNVVYLKTPTEMVLSPTATSPGLPRMYDDLVLERAILLAQIMQGETDPRQLKRTDWGSLQHRLPVEVPMDIPTVLFDEVNRDG